MNVAVGKIQMQTREGAAATSTLVGSAANAEDRITLIVDNTRSIKNLKCYCLFIFIFISLLFSNHIIILIYPLLTQSTFLLQQFKDIKIARNLKIK